MNTEKFHSLLDFPGTSPHLRTRAADFARQAHATWPDIAHTYPFPAALRQLAGETGVMGIGIDEAHGGCGGGYADISACIAEISLWSQCPGLALSIFMHQLIARFSLGALASLEQKREYLPKLAAGDMTAAQAVSEPETGGSPKRMKTRAEKSGGGWVLTGDKTFVTNGPIAELLITVAVTGEKDGRREFSAFLVPANTAGVQVRDIGPLSFLRPAPHGAATFTEVRLSKDALLGEEGKALEFFSRPFAALEDTLIAGFFAGGLSALFMCLCRDVVRSGGGTSEKYTCAGKLQAGLTTLAQLTAYGAANASGDMSIVQTLSRTTRELSLFNLSLLRDLAKNIPLAHGTQTLFVDLEKSLTIRGGHAEAREIKAGKEFLPDDGA